VFARQATVAIRAARVERDTASLLRSALGSLARGDDDGGVDADLETTISDLARQLDDESGRLWTLADAVARARRASPEQVSLVIEILDALARRSARATPRSFRR
jgi:hypothetical protein